MAFFFWVFLSTLTLASPTSGPPPAYVEREAWVMGTRLRLSVEAPSAQEAADASEKVILELGRVERVLSSWGLSSEISAINSAPPGRSVPASEELIELLVEVEGLARSTSGAFSPKVGALVDVWDFRGQGRIPEEAELALARIAADDNVITVNPTTLTVVRNHPLAWLDTDGFAGAGSRQRRHL